MMMMMIMMMMMMIVPLPADPNCCLNTVLLIRILVAFANAIGVPSCTTIALLVIVYVSSSSALVGLSIYSPVPPTANVTIGILILMASIFEIQKVSAHARRLGLTIISIPILT